jgi:hypothetical protein
LSAGALSLLTLTGCGGAANTSTNSNQANANGNSNNPLDTVKQTPATVTNDAPTLKPFFKAYCEAKVNKDEAGLRKVYSTDTIKYFESEMKAEKIKSLTDFLSDDKVTENLCEISNERITGDRAVATIKTESYPNGIDIVFIKESGDWKMTNDSPTFKTVSPSNSNTAPKAK